MTAHARSTQHSTFVIDRTYDATPERVFAAFATLDAKERWFHGPVEWNTAEYLLDFREGGREVWRGGLKGGPEHSNYTIYQDIVPNERIVFTYEMRMDRTRISVSLTTIEFFPAGNGTRMLFTEQDTFLDGYDDAGSREKGTHGLLDNLDAELKNVDA
jgi:uncharacterized protein YndB with AHSA1/START domain